MERWRDRRREIGKWERTLLRVSHCNVAWAATGMMPIRDCHSDGRVDKLALAVLCNPSTNSCNSKRGFSWFSELFFISPRRLFLPRNLLNFRSNKKFLSAIGSQNADSILFLEQTLVLLGIPPIHWTKHNDMVEIIVQSRIVFQLNFSILNNTAPSFII